MGVNKVVYGGRTVVDMTDTTATADTVLAGYTAYGADGERIVGTAVSTKRQEVTVALPLSGWVDGQQTVAVPGVTAGATIFAAGSVACSKEYDACGVCCIKQGAGTLTFETTWLPDADMVVDVVIFT